MSVPKRILITNYFAKKGDTAADKDIIYMKKLPYALRRILNWYWPKGCNILDVTAGLKKIWPKEVLNNQRIDKTPGYNVTFIDGSKESNADAIADFRVLPIKTQSQDVIIFDPPFTDVKNSGERFAYTPKQIEGHRYKYRAHQPRLFLFRNAFGDEFIPPEQHFQDTWKEFNRVSINGLIIKIAERYEKGYEIPVITYMDLCYDERLNPMSDFKRVALIGFRGNRFKLMGARMIHPQRVLTYYAIYKKDYKK